MTNVFLEFYRREIHIPNDILYLIIFSKRLSEINKDS